MIIQYKDPPSREELVKRIKQAFANMGYDTPEKRKEWYEAQKPIVLICTRIEPDGDDWPS